MATSSILTNIVIRDSKEAEVFANALEESSRDPEWKPSISALTVLTDKDAIRELMAKRGQKSESIHNC